MGYKLKHPSINSGSIQFKGQAYEVRDWMFEVADLHSANYLVEHSGCQLIGLEKVKTAQKIIIKRGQGLGDVLMMTPIMRKIKELNPGASITFACFPLFLEVCKHLPYIDRIVETPQLGYHLDTCWVTESNGSRSMHDLWINCDGIAERANENIISTTHRVDIFADIANIKLSPEERRLDYVVTKEEAEWAKRFLKESFVNESDKVLGMAVRSTAANRNMHADRFQKVAELAASCGWRIIVFDHDAKFGWEGNGIINMTGKTTLRQMGALISQCDMFFGPDSGAWHMASAINVPNVVYFGAIDWKLRVTMPRTRVIFRPVPCYPCNRYDCHWNIKHECVDISPDRIWATIQGFDQELGSRPSPRVIPFVNEKVRPPIKVEDSGHRPMTETDINSLRDGTYVH